MRSRWRSCFSTGWARRATRERFSCSRRALSGAKRRQAAGGTKFRNTRPVRPRRFLARFANSAPLRRPRRRVRASAPFHLDSASRRRTTCSFDRHRRLSIRRSRKSARLCHAQDAKLPVLRRSTHSFWKIRRRSETIRRPELRTIQTRTLPYSASGRRAHDVPADRSFALLVQLSHESRAEWFLELRLRSRRREWLAPDDLRRAPGSGDRPRARRRPNGRPEKTRRS